MPSAGGTPWESRQVGASGDGVATLMESFVQEYGVQNGGGVGCRECGSAVARTARRCAQCKAPFPGRSQWQGTGFEWKSQTTFLGFPLVHVAYGRDARGKLRVAKGVIAIGQFAIGVITLAQFGIGILFGFGQFLLALTAVAQVALTPLCGVGQLATGYVAIGQLAIGCYALGQIAHGVYTWGLNRRDPLAFAFFQRLLPFFGNP